MSKNLEELAFNIACNNSTNITDIISKIENHDCNTTQIFNSDFLFRKCNADYQSFVSIVNSIKQYFGKCIPQFLLQTEKQEYVSHIAISKNEGMGAEGIKYLVNSLCNFTCDFIKKTLNVTERPLNFLITLVNNSIVENSSLLDGCSGSEIISDKFLDTNFSMIIIDSDILKNNSCIGSNNILSHLTLHHQVSSSPNFMLLGALGVVGVVGLTGLLFANQYGGKKTNHYDSVTTTNNNSDLNNMVQPELVESNSLSITGETLMIALSH